MLLTTVTYFVGFIRWRLHSPSSSSGEAKGWVDPWRPHHQSSRKNAARSTRGVPGRKYAKREQVDPWCPCSYIVNSAALLFLPLSSIPPTSDKELQSRWPVVPLRNSSVRPSLGMGMCVRSEGTPGKHCVAMIRPSSWWVGVRPLACTPLENGQPPN